MRVCPNSKGQTFTFVVFEFCYAGLSLQVDFAQEAVKNLEECSLQIRRRGKFSKSWTLRGTRLN